jgi:DUF4097 and DUF4098 domain-containing protein YvlB
MKNDAYRYLAAATLAGAWLLTPGSADAKNYNLSVSMSNAERCSDLKISSSNGEVAQAVDSVTLGPRDLSALEIDDNSGRSVVHVRGWDHAEYQVETCKVAVADTQGNAEALVRGINVNRSAGRITTYGPSTTDGNWQVYFIVRAPRNANLDLTTKNGPISVEGITGNTKLRATNGPLSLKDVGGLVDAHTQNGPISFSGRGGDVKLTAQNGPISLELTGDSWNGQAIEAKTVNGPLSLNIPENYRSGVKLQTSGHAPLSCRLDSCRNLVTDARDGSSSRTLQLSGSGDTVRVSTSNGPVSISGPKRRAI